MRAFPWVMAGIGIGAGLTIFLMNECKGIQVGSPTGYDGVERAAQKAYGWGTKTRVGGKVRSIAGAIEEGAGRFIGNHDLADRGTADRVVGGVKDAAGRVGNALGQTIHGLNR
ncbi:MAG: hypothetical protein ABI286_03855 [Edaphobacter sp.]